MVGIPLDAVPVEDVFSNSAKLTSALQVIMDPLTDESSRYRSLQICQDFKEKYPLSLACGLHMTKKTHPNIVRHFGLQIVEHVVKFFWNHIAKAERTFLKNRMHTLILNGLRSMLIEEAHIKEITARIMVELILCDWSLHWPDMLTELDKLAMLGDMQAEMVMLVLLRLSEDIMTYQKGPLQARFKKALMEHTSVILNLMNKLLEKHVPRYRRLKIDPAQESKAPSACRAVVAVLKTLADYLDWMPVCYIADNKCKLLESLWLLLDEPEIQLHAANCLFNAIIRVGKLKFNHSLMVLFEDTPLQCILSSTQILDGVQLTEKQYFTLKKMCQLVCILGIVLVRLRNDKMTPATFGKYLDSLFKFTTHPSLPLRNFTQSIWKALFSNEFLNRNPQMLVMLPKYLYATMTNLEKVGFPSQNNGPSCIYSRFDFISDEDFNDFLITFHDKQREVIKVVFRLDPRTCFQMACQFLRCALSAPIDSGYSSYTAEDGRCHILSSFVLRLDAVTCFFETVISQIFEVLNEEDIPVNSGVELLRVVLNYVATEALIWPYILTNVATLCPFLAYRKEYSSDVIRKFFILIKGIEAPKKHVLKNIRSYACSCLARICRDYAPFFLTDLWEMYSLVKQVWSLMITQKEKLLLMEALILISNEYKNYELQKAFLEKCVAPVTSFWLSEEIKRVFSCPKIFILYVGADLKVTEPDLQDLTVQNHSKIIYCVSVILGLLRWSQRPSDPEEAKAGGFVASYAANGDPTYRNPYSALMLKILDGLLDLIRTQNNLFPPDVVSKLSPWFVKALDLPEVEKSTILDPSHPLTDMYAPPVKETMLEKMQDFFCTLYENCFRILVAASPSLMQLFYTMDNLAGRLLKSAFANVDNIPDDRIGIMLREFVKPLVLSCPQEYYQTLLVPILGPFLTSIHVRLTNKWHIIDQWNTVQKDSTAEISQDHGALESQVRLLSREVMGLITACCFPSENADISDGQSDYEEMVENEIMPTPPTSTELSELGTCLMNDQTVRSALMITAFASLVWKDDFTSYKSATQLCWSLVRQVVSEVLLPNAVVFFYTMTLKGIKEYGDNKVNCNALFFLAFQIYEALRPRYYELRNVMMEVPGLQAIDLAVFDAELCTPTVRKQDPTARKKHIKAFQSLLHTYIKKPLDELPYEWIYDNTSPHSLKPTNHAPPIRKLMDLPAPSKKLFHALTPMSPKDRSPPSKKSVNKPSPFWKLTNVPSSANAQRARELEIDDFLFSIADSEMVMDHSPPSMKPQNHSPPSMKPKNHSPPSMKRKDHSPPFKKSEPLPSLIRERKAVPSPSDERNAAGLAMDELVVSVEDDGETVMDNSAPCGKSRFQSLAPEKARDPSPSPKKSRFYSPPPWMPKALPPPSRKSRFHSPPHGMQSNQNVPPSMKSRFHSSPPGMTKDFSPCYSEQRMPDLEVGEALVSTEDDEVATDVSAPCGKSRLQLPPPETLRVLSPPSVYPKGHSPPSKKLVHVRAPFIDFTDDPAPSDEWRTPEPEEDNPLVSVEDDSETVRDPSSPCRKRRFRSPPPETLTDPSPPSRKSRFHSPPPEKLTDISPPPRKLRFHSPPPEDDEPMVSLEDDSD